MSPAEDARHRSRWAELERELGAALADSPLPDEPANALSAMRGSSIPASRSAEQSRVALLRDPIEQALLDTPEGFRAMRRMRSGRRDVAS